MNSLLFEQIDNAGLIKQGKVDCDAVSKLTSIDIIDFAYESVESTSAEDLPRQTDLFTHSASLSLGGGPWPCGEVMCRLDKVNQLVQFAAFYSDKVYIHNFLQNHLKHLESEEYPDEALMCTKFATDLTLLEALRPLIESELIVPISTLYQCPHCFVEHALKRESDKGLVKALENLARRYKREVAYSIHHHHETGEFDLVMTGPEDLLNHGYQIIVSREPPSFFRTMPKLKKRILKGEEVKLTQKLVRDVQLDTQLADRVFQNAIFALTTSQCLGTSFVTDRELDISFISDIAYDTRINRRNQIVRDYLTCFVPFIKNVTTYDVLKIRKHEQEAFIRFRQALNMAIDESLKSTSDFTQQSARDIYQDIIRPELTILNQKVKRAHKALLKGTAFKAIAWTAAIGFGLFTGILPDRLAGAAKALGLTKVLADITEGLLTRVDSKKTIQGSDMYFLWKVKHRSGK